MSVLDPVAGIINSAMGTLLFKAAIVHAVTGRTADGRGGFTPTRTERACRALITDYTDYQRATGGIPAKVRKVTILGASISSPPLVGEVVVIEGKAWTMGEMSSDPANATYTGQGTQAPMPA